MSMKYIVYEIKNSVNGKIYVGVHGTHDVNDDYYGSGKLISAAIKKYGKESFSKRVIQVCDTLDDALSLERQIVNEDFVSDKNTYNVALGGGLGGEHLNGFSFRGKKHSPDTIEKIRQFRMGKNFLTEEAKQRIIQNNKENEDRKRKISATLKGQPKSSEHKEKIRQKLLSRKSEDIPRGFKRKTKQMWINNSVYSTRINIEAEIPDGWEKGRLRK